MKLNHWIQYQFRFYNSHLKKITVIKKNASTGNRTRASRVAGENCTTQPPTLDNICELWHLIIINIFYCPILMGGEPHLLPKNREMGIGKMTVIIIMRVCICRWPYEAGHLSLLLVYRDKWGFFLVFWTRKRLNFCSIKFYTEKHIDNDVYHGYANHCFPIFWHFLKSLKFH